MLIPKSLRLTAAIFMFTMSCAPPTQQPEPQHAPANNPVLTPTPPQPVKPESVPVPHTQTTLVDVKYAPNPIDPYTEEDRALAQRIIAWKKRIDRNLWWECGHRYTEEEIPKVALEWAQAINSAFKSPEAEYTLRSNKKVRVSIKEAMGLMINESRFDRCGVGPLPRKFAYSAGILEKKNVTFSYTLAEIEAVFVHPKFAGKKADLGPGQIVKRIGKGRGHILWDEAKEYLTVIPGVHRVFTEMARRGKMYNTTTPSEYWPGILKSQWYTLRILRQAEYIFSGWKYYPERFKTKT